MVIVGTLVFVGLLQWAYINWLSVSFDYFGFAYYPPSGAYLCAGLAIKRDA